MGKILAPALLLLLAYRGRTQEDQTTSSLPGKYLMAFHAVDTTRPNWQSHLSKQVYVASSDDGVAWSLLPGYVPYKGSVPDVIRRRNTLYVYTPGTVRRYRIDNGLWEDPIPAKVKQENRKAELWVDPCAILDDRNRIVLFYLYVEKIGSNPAGCPPGVKSCTKYFRSATEVEGSDGTEFLVDSGNRAEIRITARESAADPDVFAGPSGFVLYLSRGQSVQALSSPSLRGTYTDISGLSNGMLICGSGGVPSGHYDAQTKTYWTYVFQSQGRTEVIRRARHARLDAPPADSAFTATITGATIEGLGRSYAVASPGFAVNVP